MALGNATATYRAIVVDNNDPMKANRVLMKVPQVLGDATSMWAKPHSFYQNPPPVGSSVWATFDGGDVRHPVYSAPSIAPFGDSVNGQLVLSSPKPYGYPSTGVSSIDLKSSNPGTTGSDSITLQATDTIVTGNLIADGVGNVIMVYKNNDENVTSSTAMHNDADLFFTVAANAIYRVEFVVAANGPDGGIVTAWSVPSGATGFKHCVGPTSIVADAANRGNSKMRLQPSTLNVTASYSVDHGNPTAIREDGIIYTTTAGTVRLQWGQVTSSTTATRVSSGSFVMATRIG
jgi:hypothetical protein